MLFDPQVPYDDLPDLPPTVEVETRPVLKACIDARAALAALQSSGRLIPNQAVLTNTIPLLEARASSEIENIVTTSDALFRYSQIEDQATDPATKEALRYRSALHQGYLSLQRRPVSTSTAELVCSCLKNTEMRVRRVPGAALTNAASGAVVYTPPAGEDLLRRKLAAWERFIHEFTDVDPLIRMAVAHYQFEAIHPFTDGNGRTGRVLNLLLLVNLGLLDEPVLYLSRYILRNRAEYYRQLLAVTRDGAWEEWIGFILAAVADTARWTTAKIQAIQRLHADAMTFVQARAPKIYSRELVDLLFIQPYCRIQNLVAADIAQRQTAAVYLKQLTALGVLSEVKQGREKLFIHPNFVRLLVSDDHPILPYGTVTSVPRT